MFPAEPIDNRFHSDFKELFQAVEAIFSMLSLTFRIFAANSKWENVQKKKLKRRSEFGNRRGENKENYSLKSRTRMMKEYEKLKTNENKRMKKKIGTKKEMTKKEENKSRKKWLNGEINVWNYAYHTKLRRIATSYQFERTIEFTCGIPFTIHHA